MRSFLPELEKKNFKVNDIPAAGGGYQTIYEDLLKLLAGADIADLAGRLDLPLNETGETGIPFFGKTFFLSNQGIRRSDGRNFPSPIGSGLIHYLLNGSRSRPVGKFMTLAELAGPLFKQSSYSASALEGPIVKRFKGRAAELLKTAEAVGGRRGGEAGMGSLSLIFDLLPHIPIQLIFYDQDDEFPARATLLFDSQALSLIDFEALAVLVTLFVQSLTRPQKE